MTGEVKPIPEGYHSVTPYLVVENAERLMDFLKKAFGAVEVHRTAGPDGSIRHAEARIGDSMIMMGQARAPWTPRPAMLYLYVPDVDATYAKALAAGGKAAQEPTTHFYGDRSGAVDDSQGNQWWMATHVEDVPPEELQRRAEAQQS
jgi:PhnB protein